MQRHHIAPDHQMLMRLQDRVYSAALAYYFTGDEFFAERAATPLRKFLLDPVTGMLPSLKYAQIKPGHNGLGAATVPHASNHESLCLDVTVWIG